MSSYAPLLHRVQKGLSAIELIHTPHPRWPLPTALSGSAAPPTVHISVLDSSFNPPTLAHLALANTPPPPPLPPSPPASVSTPPSARGPAAPHAFDARLLLLSVRNADKQLKPGDATYEQRIEMMVALAHDLNLASSPPAAVPSSSSPSSRNPTPNVAVAIIDEPTFVGKSPLLLAFLARLIAIAAHLGSPPAPAPRLTFLMGTDTLVRLFAPRYYADDPAAMAAALRKFLSPDADDSAVVCARRVSNGVTREREREAEERVEVEMAEFARRVASGRKVTFVDIGERECTYSSSEVRERIARGDPGWREMVTPSIAEYISTHGLYSTPI
ncbi:hypothetical protein C8Q79DRAFT_1102304 [Trametes meyenii]|nr:hypothetical protein C8Q79DRAFT_1102304 [Trametes meyenii]